MKKFFSLLAMAAFLSSFALTPAFAAEPCKCAGTGKTCMEQPCGMKDCPKCGDMKQDSMKQDNMKKEGMMKDDMKKDDMKKDGMKKM